MLIATATVIGTIPLTRTAKAREAGGDPDTVLLSRGQVDQYVPIKIYKGDKLEYRDLPKPVVDYLLADGRLVEAEDEEDESAGEMQPDGATTGGGAEGEGTEVTTGLADGDTRPLTQETLVGADETGGEQPTAGRPPGADFG